VWPDILIKPIQSTPSLCGVKNSYDSPELLGVDRWLALVAAYSYYATAVCVVDCGTAITLDVVDGQGQHLGGAIMPGLTLMKSVLSTGTAALSFCEQTHPIGLSHYTEAAIYNGSLNALAGFIAAGKLDSTLLILTGGDAQFVEEHLQLGAIIDEKLVMKGLLLAA